MECLLKKQLRIAMQEVRQLLVVQSIGHKLSLDRAIYQQTKLQTALQTGLK